MYKVYKVHKRNVLCLIIHYVTGKPTFWNAGCLSKSSYTVLFRFEILFGVPCLGSFFVALLLLGAGEGCGAGWRSYLWEVQLEALSGDGLAGGGLVKLHVEEGRKGSLRCPGLGQLLVAARPLECLRVYGDRHDKVLGVALPTL